MQELNSDTLEKLIQENKKVVVQYGASWCGVCRIIKPKFEAIANDNEDVVFVYVDAEKFPESRKLAKVDNLPTFAGFANGELVKQAMGGREAAIEEVLNEVTSH